MNGNNGLGGWTPQPVSLNTSQAASTLVMGQMGVFSNRTVVSVPPGSNTSVVLLVPPGSSMNVEIKDRQVVVTTVSTIYMPVSYMPVPYMPAPMTPQSGQILFDRGVATLAQNKGYSIPEASDLADRGMQWARANFGSDYRQAESQFMNWINGAPDRANNPSFQSVADSVPSEPEIKTSQSSAQAHYEEAGSTSAGLKSAPAPGDSVVSDDPIYTTVDRPSTAPAGSVSEKMAASEEEATANTNRPATAPASFSSEETLGQDSSPSYDYLDGVAELFAEPETTVDNKNTVASGKPNDDAASAPASENVTRPSTAPAGSVSEKMAVSEEEATANTNRPATAPASMGSDETLGQDSSPSYDYLDGVAELFAEPETTVDNKNTVASGKPNDDAASAPASENVTRPSTAPASSVSEKMAVSEEEATANTNRPATAPASMGSDETLGQDSSPPDDYLDGVAKTETTVDNKNTVASDNPNDDAASENVTGGRPLTAPAASPSSEETLGQDSPLPDDVAASENITVDRPVTAPPSFSSEETLGQDSSPPDDYLDSVAETETTVDNKNTVASGKTNDDAASTPASENVTGGRPLTAPAASPSSEETLGQQDSPLPDDDVAASENITVDRPVTAPPSFSSEETLGQDSSLPDDYLDGVTDSVQSEPEIKTSQSSAQAHYEEAGSTSAGLKSAPAPGDSAVYDDPIYATVDRPSTAPAGSVSEKMAASEEEATAITNRPAAAPASMSSEETLGQDSSPSYDYLDGVPELFAEPETTVDNKNTVASSAPDDIAVVQEPVAAAGDVTESEVMDIDDGYVSEEDVSESEDGAPQEIHQTSAPAPVMEEDSIAAKGDDINPGHVSADEMAAVQDDLSLQSVKAGEKTTATVAPKFVEEAEDDGYFSDQDDVKSEPNDVPPDLSRIKEKARQRKAAQQAVNQQQLDTAGVEYSTSAGSGRKIIDDPLDLSNVESSGYAKPNKLKMKPEVGSEEYKEMVRDRKLLGVTSVFNELNVARSAYKKLQENDSNLAMSQDIVKAAKKYITLGIASSKPLLRQPDDKQLDALETLGLDGKASERAVLLALIDQAAGSLDVNKKTQHENKMKVLDKAHKTLFGRG